MGKVSLLRRILNCFAFNKPWFYLMLLCWLIMFIFVQFGNPLLPFPSLREYGWAWHHISEIFMFFFFGMWWSEWKIFPIRRIQDVTTITLLTAIFFAYSIVYNILFAVVGVSIIFIIPFIVGYFIKRWHT